ncbi:succinate dehydrogenase, cytochrome b556 subunit [Endothiovibrio diazotrophicus]
MNSRPTAPHLTIYRLPPLAWLSVFHRVTGVALAGAAVGLALWLVALALGPVWFARVQGLLASWIGQLGLAAVLFALCYHLCNGLRHLAWDRGYGLALPVARVTGGVVAVAAALLTAGVWWWLS